MEPSSESPQSFVGVTSNDSQTSPNNSNHNNNNNNSNSNNVKSSINKMSTSSGASATTNHNNNNNNNSNSKNEMVNGDKNEVNILPKFLIIFSIHQYNPIFLLFQLSNSSERINSFFETVQRVYKYNLNSVYTCDLRLRFMHSGESFKCLPWFPNQATN